MGSERRINTQMRSVFDLSPDFFDSCRLLHHLHDRFSYSSSQSLETNRRDANEDELKEEEEEKEKRKEEEKVFSRWSCNTCKAEFDCLEDQRSHFKSDLHRFNVKLSIAGKAVIKEEEFDESASDSLFKDNDISSISGSEDEADKVNEIHKIAGESDKQKIFISLETGEVVSVWKTLLLNESETLCYDDDTLIAKEIAGTAANVCERKLIKKLKDLITESRDKTQLRILLLAGGGHFAGCVFDGNSVVAHKTFHRYVVRAKAGKKQSSKDASGKAANSAGASLRRYNELALKKEIQDLLHSWKPYFDASSCVFIHAPSNNRQLLFNGEEPYFSYQHCFVRRVPFTVRRPTLKEAKRIYNHLTNLTYEVLEKDHLSSSKDDSQYNIVVTGNLGSNDKQLVDYLDSKEVAGGSEIVGSFEALSTSSENRVIGEWTILHEAATSGNAQWTMKLLDKGLDPCIKDERGRTPYMLATDKEVRNTFRRFMALNLDKWDWHAAKVPSPLPKELEESQAAKQAEKDAKRKAKAKELKKLRRAKEKKARDQAAASQTAPIVSQGQQSNQDPVVRQHIQSTAGVQLSKEEELKRAQDAEREKRAAAAEKRIAAAAALKAQMARPTTTTAATPSNSGPSNGKGVLNDINCSFCKTSLAGKVPFHRYHYKYCSTSCMHVHREMLEDS